MRSLRNSALLILLVSGLAALLLKGQVLPSSVDDTQHKMALVHVFNQAREHCYAAPNCTNLDELMSLFTPDVRRTEINRANDVVRLEGQEALRADSLRVAGMFTGRRLETTAVSVQGRNVIFLQSNWDPGAQAPNPFTHILRIQDGKIAHWVLVAP